MSENEEPKPAKKKLLKVAKLPGEGQMHYGISSFNYAIISGPGEGHQQLTVLQTCREGLCSCIATAIEDKKPVDRTKLRLLVVQDVADSHFDKFREKLFSGKAAMNVIEERGGWTPRTVITTVKHEVYKSAWLITAHEKWMLQPQFVSLAGLLMRLAMNIGPLVTTSFDDLMKNLKKIGSTGSSGDASHCETVYDKIGTIVDNYDKLFGNIPFDKAWKKHPDYSFGSQCGITTFCRPDYRIEYSSLAKKAKEMLQGMLKK